MKYSCFILLLFPLFVFANKKATSTEATSYKIAVVSDLHYMDPSLVESEGAAFTRYVAEDRKLLKESSLIINGIIDSLLLYKPDLVFVCGDLTKDGERLNHEKIQSILQKLVDAGAKVLVVPGNHDVNNPHAVVFQGDKTFRVPTINAAQFDSIYQNMGYGQAISKDKYSLSYITEPLPGLCVLALDATKSYANSFDSNTCITPGAVKPETLEWARKEVRAARAEGKRVFSLLHYGLLDHYKNQSVLFLDYIIDNNSAVSEMFMEEGVSAVFTGHYHANDIVGIKKDGKSLYDIETGSAVTWPCPFRLISYQGDVLDIQTHHVKSIDISLPDNMTFDAYARQYVSNGIRSYTEWILPNLGINRENLAFSRVSNLVVDAFMAHYIGDEVSTLQKKKEISRVQQDVKKIPKQMRKLMNIVWEMYDDTWPADNQIQILLDPVK